MPFTTEATQLSYFIFSPLTFSIPYFLNQFTTVSIFWGLSYSGENMSKVSSTQSSLNCLYERDEGKVPSISQIGINLFNILPRPIFVKNLLAEIIQSILRSINWYNLSYLIFLVKGRYMYFACSFVHQPLTP